MQDFDPAALYEVETKTLKQAVKRNIGRFPEDFTFKLTIYEWKTMRSQFATGFDNELMRSHMVTAS